MSSKTLHFSQTADSIKKKVLDDLYGMTDISFNTINQTAVLNTDVQMLSPEESVVQSLKNLMALPVGGNVLFPTRGERVGDMLFAVGLTKEEAQTMLISYLNANEPRIVIRDITSSKKVDEYNEQIVTLNVSYSFKNSNEIYNAIVDLKSTADLSNVPEES